MIFTDAAACPFSSVQTCVEKASFLASLCDAVSKLDGSERLLADLIILGMLERDLSARVCHVRWGGATLGFKEEYVTGVLDRCLGLRLRFADKLESSAHAALSEVTERWRAQSRLREIGGDSRAFSGLYAEEIQSLSLTVNGLLLSDVIRALKCAPGKWDVLSRLLLESPSELSAQASVDIYRDAFGEFERVLFDTSPANVPVVHRYGAAVSRPVAASLGFYSKDSCVFVGVASPVSMLSQIAHEFGHCRGYVASYLGGGVDLPLYASEVFAMTGERTAEGILRGGPLGNAFFRDLVGRRLALLESSVLRSSAELRLYGSSEDGLSELEEALCESLYRMSDLQSRAQNIRASDLFPAGRQRSPLSDLSYMVADHVSWGLSSGGRFNSAWFDRFLDTLG